MIQSIDIQNLKSIEKENFNFKPITILTGANSSGKSSIIQAILLYSYHCAQYTNSLKSYIKELGEPQSLICKKRSSKDKQIIIRPKINNKNAEPLIFNEKWNGIKQSPSIVFEQNLYYISANRIGQENLPQNDDYEKCGVNGEYIFGFYERQKEEVLKYMKLLSDKATGKTLEEQVYYWLKKILKLSLQPSTNKINNTYIKLAYKNFDLDNLNGIEMSPFNLGAGVSYLAKILILGLSLKEGDILIVENPEVHLHPNAIANFAEFFAFLAQNGIQVILETHSEHILNKMRYFVFDKKSSLDKIQLSTNDVQIYYRENFDKEFIALNINNDGRYIDKDGKVVNFPTGFFDSVLNDLLEMF